MSAVGGSKLQAGASSRYAAQAIAELVTGRVNRFINHSQDGREGD